MEPFFIYLLKCAGIATLFLIVYVLLLKQETFFEHNRYFLLAGIAASLLLPFAIFTKTIYIVQEPLTMTAVHESIDDRTASGSMINGVAILLYTYLAVSGMLLVRFLVQLWSLLRLISSSSITRDGNFKMVRTATQVAPFSFFNYIVYHPESHDDEELYTIIEHEKIHAGQWHSIDILLIHLFTILLWIHPLVWLYKKSITQNLEYIADGKASRTVKCIKTYQYLLLNASTRSYSMAVANNFFNSLIKKRIVMLNKHKSQQRNMWKYGIIIPLLAAFLFTFNVKTIAQVKVIEVKKVKKDKNNAEEVYYFSIDKNTTDAKLKQISKKIEDNDGDFKYKKVKRNTDGEITSIKIEFRNGKDSFVNGSYTNDDGIEPIVIVTRKDGGVSMHSGRDHDEIHIDEDSGYNVRVKSHSRKKHQYNDADEENEEEEEVVIVEVREEEKEEIIIMENEEAEEIEIEDEEEEIVVVTGIADISKKEGKKKKTHKIKRKYKNDSDEVIIINSDDNKEPIYVVDGKVTTKKKTAKLNPDNIEEIEVLKGKSAVVKYGKNAGDGVVEIKTKKNNDAEPIIIINGKQATKKLMKNLDEEEIEKVNVLKGEYAIEKYGKKAKDSVVEITTKKEE